jgi:hypothetical protein
MSRRILVRICTSSQDRLELFALDENSLEIKMLSAPGLEMDRRWLLTPPQAAVNVIAAVNVMESAS